MPTIVDHVFVALLVVGVPLYSARFSWPRLKNRDLADAGPDARIRIYWGIIGPEWLLTLMALATWLVARRPWADFGWALEPGWRLWAGTGAAAAVGAALTIQYIVVARSAAGRGRVLTEIRETAPFAPQTRREMTHFTALALTAGICEEILYRGFLIWYVVQFTGTGVLGLTVAVVASAIVFGIDHLYQGRIGAARVAGLALVFGGLYVVTESLWPVILLHAYIDLAGGFLSLAAQKN
ncbi:MAG: CPBP family intramembrane glutamic endopeptidase [Planctomycetota bacterium]